MKTDLDIAQGIERERVVQLVRDGDVGLWIPHARVDKFSATEVQAVKTILGLKYREPTGPELLEWGLQYDTVESVGNLLTTAGLHKLTGLAIVAGGQGWNAANTRIGVGNSATAATVADTDLNGAAGSSNRQFELVDSIARSNGVITAIATFETGDANFAWQEWGIDNGTADGTTVTATLLNHKVVSLGTKTSASAWVFTVTITIA